MSIKKVDAKLTELGSTKTIPPRKSKHVARRFPKDLVYLCRTHGGSEMCDAVQPLEFFGAHLANSFCTSMVYGSPCENTHDRCGETHSSNDRGDEERLLDLQG